MSSLPAVAAASGRRRSILRRRRGVLLLRLLGLEVRDLLVLIDCSAAAFCAPLLPA